MLADCAENHPLSFPRIIVSSGFGRFQLRLTAGEAERRAALAGFIAGAYPTPWLARCIETAGLRRVAAIGRFLARATPVRDEHVHGLWAGEPFHQIAARIRRISEAGKGVADRLDLVARGLYAAGASRIVGRLAKAADRGIYHYRAGFGGVSVDVARRRGWVCLCDHTIAHPAVLEYLVTHAGSLPPTGEAGPIDRNWRAILADIERADHVLTTCDFVRSTFVHQGWDDDRISVIQIGVDDEFLSLVPEVEPSGDGPLRLLFAGSFGRRKGAPELAEAVSGLCGVDWRLDLCGPIEASAAAAFERLSADDRVTYHGTLLAPALASRMAAADVFVFPTLAEGSARVVFEALAAGCYVITTPNCGSIVVDGEHGQLVAPGNVRELLGALRKAASDRPRVLRIGARNATLVPRTCRQANYGARLFELYEHLLQR